MNNYINIQSDGKTQLAGSDAPPERTKVVRSAMVDQKAEREAEYALALARWADDGGPTGPEK